MTYPKEYRYTRDHEWLHVEGNKAKIGITDHAQAKLGDIVFVELPSVGTKLAAGDALGTVESVKAVGDVFAPIAGVVVDVNSDLETAPDTINKDPHGAGWIAVIEFADAKQLDELMDAAAYEDLSDE
ncbi:glycine cleavage system protein GcvH [Candidatus Bipolaricaulota bacterium]|nr:glycine cleavage system protein GcvH [Candidatus Bipolaricaulota bacterium]